MRRMNSGTFAVSGLAIVVVLAMTSSRGHPAGVMP